MSFQASTPRKARFVPGFLMFLFCFGFGVEALAQSDVSRRLNRLENEIQTLSRALFRGEELPTGVVIERADAQANAQVEIRLQQLEQELRDLRGTLEEIRFSNESLQRDVERFKGDLELRIQDLERSGRASNATTDTGSKMGYATRNPAINPDDVIIREPPQPLSNATQGGNDFTWSSGSSGRSGGVENSLGTLSSPQSGADGATTLYERAFALLKNADYNKAQSEFQGFLNQHPDHILAGNAKYWLGETYYVRGEFEDAARLFAQGYQEFPKGSKAADNLLKLGMSLSALGKNEDACIALSQIETGGFRGVDSVLSRAEQEKSRLGCV